MFAALELLVAIITPQDDVLDHSFLLPNVTAATQLETLVPQVESVPHATHDFVVQLRMICDSALHAYLSKIADTGEKRDYLHVSRIPINAMYPSFQDDFDTFLDDLHKLRVFDLQPSDFQPHDLRPLLVTTNDQSLLSDYIEQFISDPKRSREFHCEPGVWVTFVATRFVRYLRTLSHSR